MILLVDNHDSFVFNLARYIEELGYQVQVSRNNTLSIEDIHALQPTHIILSPGPCGPKEAGICIDVVRQFAGKIPIAGVCLGHQVIGHVYGGRVTRAREPMHGKSSWIEHDGTGLFQGLPSPLQVGRYHSLIVEEEGLSPDMTITSRSTAGEIMSIENRTLKLAGMQFHPESVLTSHGHAILKNFIRMTAQHHSAV